MQIICYKVEWKEKVHGQILLKTILVPHVMSAELIRQLNLSISLRVPDVHVHTTKLPPGKWYVAATL